MPHTNLINALYSCLDAYCSIQEPSGLELPLDVVLAFSGGLDSVVLLDLLVKQQKFSPVRYNLSAVYIDHQLQADSTTWVNTNREICASYNVNYESYAVEILKDKSKSIESLARIARYGQLSKIILNSKTVLITAHHLDDQAETFLLQLTRSAGPRGLSAMPKIKSFSKGYHLRPLLDMPKRELQAYAEHHHLHWVDDKTNSDTKYDRNYIRHQILPRLIQRWPNMMINIANSAKNCAEHELLLNEYLAEDYQKTICESNLLDKLFTAHSILDVTKLQNCSIEKQRGLLRYWLRKNNTTLPDRNVIHQIILMLSSNLNKTPKAKIGVHWVRRHKNKLYLISDNEEKLNCIDYPNVPYKLGSAADLHGLAITVTSVKVRDFDKQSDPTLMLNLNVKTDQEIIICFRRGGERCRPSTRKGSVSLKKLLQEHDIPPWQRNKLPLLYIDGQLAAIPGVTICEGFESNLSNLNSWVISFKKY